MKIKSSIQKLSFSLLFLLSAVVAYSQQDNSKITVVVLGTGDATNIAWSEYLPEYNVINACEPVYAQFFTRQLDYRLATRVLKYNPKYCIVYGGVSDILLQSPIRGTLSGYKKVCDSLVAHQITPIVVGLLPFSDANLYCNSQISMLNRKLEVLADENNYPFCSASSGLLTDNVLSKAYTNDGYLLNKEGRTVFAKNIANYLKSLIAFRQGVSLPVATSCNFTRDGLKNIVQKSPATVNIVMLGNSITNGGGDWNKKLNRNDVRNAGIGGYTSGQMLWHMDSSVVAAHPKMCFVMAGINDLGNQIPLDLIFRNQKMIIAKLLANNIKPVMQLTLYKAGNIEMNKNVDKINATLVEYCKAQNIDYIDLNPSLSDETGLKKEYTTDGTHLKEPAYAIWSKILMEYLEQHK